jgi:hypothetical protein
MMHTRLSDLVCPFLVLTLTYTFLASLPLVITATRNFHNAAHLLQSVLGAVFVHERIFYRRSFAKKCIASFNRTYIPSTKRTEKITTLGNLSCILRTIAYTDFCVTERWRSRLMSRRRWSTGSGAC